MGTKRGSFLCSKSQNNIVYIYPSTFWRRATNSQTAHCTSIIWPSGKFFGGMMAHGNLRNICTIFLDNFSSTLKPPQHSRFQTAPFCFLSSFFAGSTRGGAGQLLTSCKQQIKATKKWNSSRLSISYALFTNEMKISSFQKVLTKHMWWTLLSLFASTCFLLSNRCAYRLSNFLFTIKHFSSAYVSRSEWHGIKSELTLALK